MAWGVDDMHYGADLRKWTKNTPEREFLSNIYWILIKQ